MNALTTTHTSVQNQLILMRTLPPVQTTRLLWNPLQSLNYYPTTAWPLTWMIMLNSIISIKMFTRKCQAPTSAWTSRYMKVLTSHQICDVRRFIFFDSPKTRDIKLIKLIETWGKTSTVFTLFLKIICSRLLEPGLADWSVFLVCDAILVRTVGFKWINT